MQHVNILMRVTCEVRKDAPVQDIIEKQEFSGSFDNNNNDVVCLRLPVLYCPGRGKG